MEKYLREEAKHSHSKSKEQSKPNKKFNQIKIMVTLRAVGQLPLAGI